MQSFYKLQASVQRPCDRYMTTYNRDYQPFNEHNLQVSQAKTEAAAAPPSAVIPPHIGHMLCSQDKRDPWPRFYNYIYKTTNSAYGSSAEPPSCFLFPASTSPFGVLPPSIFQDRAEAVRVATETMHLRCEEEKENVLEQQEGNDGQQEEMDVLCEKDTIVFSSQVDPACCEDLIRSLCREAELQRVPSLSSHFSPIITNKVAENWDNSDYLWGMAPAANVKSGALVPSTSWQCSCCDWETANPNSGCLDMQICPPNLPQVSNLRLTRVPPSMYCTEYQSSYGAKWFQSNIYMSDLHGHHPRRPTLF